MNSRQKKLLKECLPDKNTTFHQKTGSFTKIFNSNSTDPKLQSEKWHISNERLAAV
jgi:hypothetical protein